MSTLEHLKYADILIHVRDISHPMSEKQNQVVLDVMKKIGINHLIDSHDYIEVRNKVDIYLE